MLMKGIKCVPFVQMSWFLAPQSQVPKTSWVTKRSINFWGLSWRQKDVEIPQKSGEWSSSFHPEVASSIKLVIPSLKTRIWQGIQSVKFKKQMTNLGQLGLQLGPGILLVADAKNTFISSTQKQWPTVSQSADRTGLAISATCRWILRGLHIFHQIGRIFYCQIGHGFSWCLFTVATSPKQLSRQKGMPLPSCRHQMIHRPSIQSTPPQRHQVMMKIYKNLTVAFCERLWGPNLVKFAPIKSCVWSCEVWGQCQIRTTPPISPTATYLLWKKQNSVFEEISPIWKSGIILLRSAYVNQFATKTPLSKPKRIDGNCCRGAGVWVPQQLFTAKLLLEVGWADPASKLSSNLPAKGKGPGRCYTSFQKLNNWIKNIIYKIQPNTQLSRASLMFLFVFFFFFRKIAATVVDMALLSNSAAASSRTSLGPAFVARRGNWSFFLGAAGELVGKEIPKFGKTWWPKSLIVPETASNYIIVLCNIYMIHIKKRFRKRWKS